MMLLVQWSAHATNVTRLLVQPNASAPPPVKMIHVGADRIPNQYLVIFDDDLPVGDVPALVQTLASTYAAEVKTVWADSVKGMFVYMTEAAATAVSQTPHVKYVEENAPWYVSSQQQTNVDPRVCDPVAGTCPTVTDDRLWHLDRVDQNDAPPSNLYGSCTDGTGVTVYVVDFGMNKNHNEFGAGGAIVRPGFNASNDNMPADDTCLGFARPVDAFGPYSYLENPLYDKEMTTTSHGTAVASALGGRRVGVAKNVTIVPIKTARCDQYAARYRVPNAYYALHQTIFRPDSGGGSIQSLYRADTEGYAGSGDPPSWPTGTGATVQDNQVLWTWVDPNEWRNVATTAMLFNGLHWILSTANTEAKSKAIVTMSVYRLATDAQVAGTSGTVESEIRDLLAHNITVVVSANNQNGDACDTSPSRLSINNPNTSIANNVITAGGAMLRNRPWNVDISDVPDGVLANGAGDPFNFTNDKGPEPAPDPTQPVRDARWICGLGDAANFCSNATPTSTPSPLPTAAGNPSHYYFYNAGSNGGPCVTLFAPAKNLFLASLGGPNSYRDGRLRAAYASGTSWSAPIVAGAAARILQINGTFTPAQVRDALLSSCVSTTATDTLNPSRYDGVPLTGTPNKFLTMSDVVITAQPASVIAQSGGTPLTVTASGPGLLYQWYEVNPTFDYATYKKGAGEGASTKIAGATAGTYTVAPSASRRAFWARVMSLCGSADTNIAVVVPVPSAPTGVGATATGTSVTVTWNAANGADAYQVQRKIAGQTWTVAGEVSSPALTYTETPSAPEGMVVYRVVTTAGAAYLPPGTIAMSAPSNNDFANVRGYTDDPLTLTTIQAQHLIELRQAVNALCHAVDATNEYQPAELSLGALQNALIQAGDFTSLLAHINHIRTDAAIGAPPANFTETPVANLEIKKEHLQNLRDALR